MGCLAGKTAIITGAGYAKLSNGRCGSIGYGIATAYAKEGANLVITGRNVKKLTDAKEELERLYGVKVLCVQADVNDSADNEAVVNNVVKQAIDTFGRIDVLINNAQASASGVPLADHTTEQLLPLSEGNEGCCHQLCLRRGPVWQLWAVRVCRGKGRHSRPDPRCRHRMGQGRYQRQRRLPAGMDDAAGELPEGISRGVQGECQDAPDGPLRRLRGRNWPCVRPAGFPGLQIHVRRDHHP